MTPRVGRWLALFLAFAAGIWGWRWWTSEERRLGRSLARLEAAVEKRGPESELARFAKARELVELFAPGFVIYARPYEGTITDRQQLAAVVDRYRATATRIAVRDRERHLELRENGTAEMTCVLTVDGLRESGPGREAMRVRIGWVREAGSWRVLEFEILEVLESSGLLG